MISKTRIIIERLGGEASSKRFLSRRYLHERTAEGRYVSCKWLAKQIERITGVLITEEPVRKLVKELGIKRRPNTERIPKHPFSGTKEDKLYLWGLCEDAYLRKVKTVLVVNTYASPRTAQCFTKAFKKYNEILSIRPFSRTSDGREIVQFNLDLSFSFLLETPEAVTGSVDKEEEFASLVAGLIDSDGFAYQRGKSHLKVLGISHSNKTILEMLETKAKNLGLHPHIYAEGRKGDVHSVRGRTFALKNDFWHFVFLRNDDLKRLTPMLQKSVKHELRLTVLKRILNYVNRQKSSLDRVGRESVRELLTTNLLLTDRQLAMLVSRHMKIEAGPSVISQWRRQLGLFKIQRSPKFLRKWGRDYMRSLLDRYRATNLTSPQITKELQVLTGHSLNPRTIRYWKHNVGNGSATQSTPGQSP